MAGLDFPVVCPRLVGREEQLVALESALHGAASGEGTVILVNGEAGIGKTRLITELKHRMEAGGWATAEMACYEQDAQVPYSGIFDLLNRLSKRGLSALDAQVPSGLDAIFASDDQQTIHSPSADPHQERERIIAAVLRELVALAGEKRCLLLVEDLHWSDGNTLLLLLSLARQAREQRLHLVMTLRAEDATDDVRGFLADLDRERLSSELRLTRLSLADTDEMVKAIFQSSRSTGIDLLHGLYRLTEGNPFFVEEVLRSMVANSPLPEVSALRLDRARVPRTVLEAVGQRIETLSPEARSLLNLASVFGVRFDLSHLETVSELDEDATLAGVRELIRCQLIVEEENGGFAFSHALTREAVASGLLRREKAILHNRVAGHLESLPDARDRPEDLSYHFFESGQFDKAQRYAELAGARALAMFAPAIALEHFSRAIDAASRTGSDAASETYRGRASAFEALGNFERAREDLEHAVWLAEQASDVSALIDCYLDLGLLWASRDYGQALAAYRRAVELAESIDDRSRLARSLSRLANGLTNVGDFDEALRHFQQALQIQRELGERNAIAETLDLIGMAGLMGGQFQDSLAAYQEALQTMEAEAERRHRVSVLASIPVLSGTFQTSMLVPALSLRDARPYAEEAVKLARESGVPSDLSYALWQYGFWRGPQAGFSQALAAATESLHIAQETLHKQWEAAALAVIGALYTDVLRPADALICLRQALELSREIKSSLWEAQMSNLLVDALLLDGRRDEAVVLLGMSAGRDTFDAPRSMYDVWLLSARAEVAFAMDDFVQARRIIDAIARTRAPGLRLRRLLALMAMKEGDLSHADTTLTSLAASASEQGHKSLEWRLLCDLAHCRLSAGRRDSAREAASSALQVIDLVASGTDEPESFRRIALLHLPASLRERPARTIDGALTTREVEIAGFIADGLTNREIAERLVLSSRTVETHVANAMAKLGFTSRAQLAAWFIEHRTSS